MELAGKPLDEWQQGSAILLLSTRDDGRWACVEYCELVARQNGKGGVLEARVLAGFLLLGERVIMWSAHEVKTAYEAFLRLQELLRVLDPRSEDEKAADENFILVDDELVSPDPIPIRVVNTNGREGFRRLDTKQRVRFIARSKSSGRGLTGDLNVIDETFAYTAAQHEALFPTMMARPNPQIIYTSTPPLDGFSGDVLHDLRDRAERALEEIVKQGFTTDDKLGFRDWGIAGDLANLDKLDLDDPELWAQANPSLGGRISAEIILLARRSMSAVGFAREVLCVWPRRKKRTGGVVDVARWNGPLLDERVKTGGSPTPMEGRVAVAVDVSPDRSRASIGAAGRRGDELLAVERIEAGAGTRWLLPFLKQLVAAQGPLALVVDPAAAAGSLISDLEDLVEDTSTVLMLVSGREYGQACGAFMDFVEAEQLRHIGQKSLTSAIEGASTRTLGDAWAWDRRSQDVDITPLVAVTLALAGFRAHENDEADTVEPWIHFGDDDEDD
jgi:hypothetical protein